MVAESDVVAAVVKQAVIAGLETASAFQHVSLAVPHLVADEPTAALK